MTTATKAPPMTAHQARSFSRESQSSYMQIAAQLTCSCEPYRDTFTFRRWLAQGFAVTKGQKGIKFSSYVPAKGRDAEDSEGEPFLLPRTLVVFCRHQVSAVQS